MANLSTFLKGKLLRVFTTFFDLNDDGVIGWRDFQLCTERIRSVHCWDIDGEEHTRAKATMKNIWNGLRKCADENMDNSISEEEWCNMWRDSIQHLREGEMADWHREYMDFMFSVNDMNGDEVIDKEEYTDTYMCYGLSKENCHNAFDIISEHSTLKVDKDYFRSLWIEYFSSDDPKDQGNHIFGTVTQGTIETQEKE